MEDIEEIFYPKEIESLLSNLWETMKNAPLDQRALKMLMF